jgi:hypothetical protein
MSVKNAIIQQNEDVKNTLNSFESKSHYQTKMVESVKTVNTYLLFFYYFLFILIHVLFAEQYFRGVKRNELVDTLFFTWFFIYPAVIYYVEAYLYFAITYVWSFISGSSYVFDFDKLFIKTDFYAEPNNITPDGIPSLSTAFT